QAFREISLPLFGLVLVVLPYLPWLPDRIAPLRALAGPIVKIIWLVIAGQVVLMLLAVRAAYAAAYPKRSTRRIFPFAIALITAGICAWAPLRFDRTLTAIALIGASAFSPAAYHRIARVIVAFAGLAAASISRCGL